MQYRDDKQGSKFTFFVIFVLFIYLTFFNFDIEAAYQFTYQSLIDFLSGMF